MDRNQALQAVAGGSKDWDILIIGGGATGLGAAVDAASRGYQVLLLEARDFAQGTSSRSTKLVHGGVRYLKQAQFSLVYGALRERGLICQNAPHVAHAMKFVIPVYHKWEKLFYGLGMKVYDLLSGKLNLGPSCILSREAVMKALPNVATQGLQGGVSYVDGQFDDARLAVNLAQTASEQGGIVINYMPVTALLKTAGRIVGATARDEESGQSYPIKARVVINATGVFCDSIRQFDEPGVASIVTISQGSHIILPKRFLAGEAALMVPRTRDGRVLFAVPWYDRVILGTTDMPVPAADLEPRALEEEIDFLFTHAQLYLSTAPQRSDTCSIFTGLRPLVSLGKTRSTAKLSRDHTLLVSNAGLVTITGGKWTTYRKMAEEAINCAEDAGGLGHRPCITANLPIHGYCQQDAQETSEHWRVYGSDAALIQALALEDSTWGERIVPSLPYILAEVVWAVRHEMARTLEDIFARRTRALLLDARATMEAAPSVAALLAKELRKEAAWQQEQIAAYRSLAAGYIL